jgi:16S rRNA (uracil1498-N3)-methyltransferase
MSSRRIHIEHHRIRPGGVPLLRSEVRHLVTVLGLHDGDAVTVFDGEGREYDAMLCHAGRGEAAALSILGPGRSVPAPGLDITLIVAIIKNKNFDLVVQKAVELGTTRLMPVVTARTVKQARSGVSRWQKISVEASRQCGRGDVMDVADVTRFDKAVAECGAGLKLLAWERGGMALAEAVRTTEGKTIAIAAGPEGGFSDPEVGLAESAGFVPVTLGPRILRTETVPLALLAIMQYLFGDLSGAQR